MNMEGNVHQPITVTAAMIADAVLEDPSLAGLVGIDTCQVDPGQPDQVVLHGWRVNHRGMHPVRYRVCEFDAPDLRTGLEFLYAALGDVQEVEDEDEGEGEDWGEVEDWQ